MKKLIIIAGALGSITTVAQSKDSIKTRTIDEVVVSSTRKSQKITEVPATVNIITSKEIAQFSSFNVAELAARQKGVDFVRSGVLGAGFNIRGFNTAFNSKNLQITDDRISTLIATGLPLGTMETLIKEDIGKVEILLGPNGTLYGPNAHNGLINTMSKDIFKSLGTTIVLGGGNQNVFSARLRHAQAINDKLAFKLSFEHSQGTEFKYSDSVYINNKAYEELDLDRDFKIDKLNAQMVYKVGANQSITGFYGHSNSNMIGVTNAGRNQIKDWSIDILQFKYNSPRWFLNAYYTWSSTDKTYAMNQRTQNYWSFKNNGFSEEEARRRSFAEQWFPLGGGAGIPLKRGALFIDDSNRFNAEVQYNNTWGNLTVVAGSQYQYDMANSKGTYLLDQNGVINVGQLGFYGQADYKLENDWMFLVAARVDNHDFYGTNFIPKAAITKKLGDGTLRLTYGKGISVPPIMNLKGYLFGGLVLGNGEGFTLSDGTKIDKLKAETIDTFELGYKAVFNNKVFFDVNAYYNINQNFTSPLLNIARPGVTVTHMGNTPIAEIPGANPAMVLTYQNFGKVDTYGLDIGVNYYLNDNWSLNANYSYFGRHIDKNDMNNDGNRDGKVTEFDLPINTPANKFSLGAQYTKGGFYAGVFGRYVQKYDFFSGIYAAAKTQNIDGVQITENARYGSSWNYGQLGGFMLDANAGYNFDSGLTVGVSGSNLLNANVREFVASPVIGTLVSLEVRYNINFFKK